MPLRSLYFCTLPEAVRGNSLTNRSSSATSASPCRWLPDAMRGPRASRPPSRWARRRDRPLAGVVVGHPDHRHLFDSGARSDARFQPQRARCSESVADDQVFGAAGDREMACRIQDAEVTRREPAVGVEGVGILRQVEIACTPVGSAAVDFALDSGRRRRSVGTLDNDVYTRERPTVGAPECINAVGDQPAGDGRMLGGSVGPQHGDTPPSGLLYTTPRGRWIRRGRRSPFARRSHR